MRLRDVLYCLAAMLFGQNAQCIPVQSSSSSTDLSQSDRLQRRRPNGPVTSSPPVTGDLDQAENSSATSDILQPKSTDDSTISPMISLNSATPSQATTDMASSTINFPISTTTDSKIPTATNSRASTITADVQTTSSSSIDTTLTSSASTSSTLSATVISSATASPAQPFRMSGESIAVTVVLCCFVFGGAAIMLFYRVRRHRANQRHQQWINLAPDAKFGTKSTTFGHSSTSSAASARESMMYHPEHRGSQVVVASSGHDWSHVVKEQEPPLDYRLGQNQIPLSEVEPDEEAGRSQMSPLIRPALPRPVSTLSRKSGRSSLRREFSFEDTPISPPVPSPMLNRRSALTSNPPSDWPLFTPSYYGRGFVPTARAGASDHRTQQQ